MSTRKPHQFVVRELRSDSELTLCSQLDHTYETDYVWQMDLRDEPDGIGVRFRTVRLPRVMQVDYPYSSQHLLQSWQQRDCFLVAAVENVVLGYVNMRTDTVQCKGWIRDLVVGKPFRLRRIGSALLEQAERWAQLRGINHLMLEIQTKNYGAMQFARSRGFSFCGFHDDYYANHDITVYFSKKL